MTEIVPEIIAPEGTVLPSIQAVLNALGAPLPGEWRWTPGKSIRCHHGDLVLDDGLRPGLARVGMSSEAEKLPPGSWEDEGIQLAEERTVYAAPDWFGVLRDVFRAAMQKDSPAYSWKTVVKALDQANPGEWVPCSGQALAGDETHSGLYQIRIPGVPRVFQQARVQWTGGGSLWLLPIRGKDLNVSLDATLQIRRNLKPYKCPPST